MARHVEEEMIIVEPMSVTEFAKIANDYHDGATAVRRKCQEQRLVREEMALGERVNLMKMRSTGSVETMKTQNKNKYKPKLIRDEPQKKRTKPIRVVEEYVMRPMSVTEFGEINNYYNDRMDAARKKYQEKGEETSLRDILDSTIMEDMACALPTETQKNYHEEERVTTIHPEEHREIIAEEEYDPLLKTQVDDILATVEYVEDTLKLISEFTSEFTDMKISNSNDHENSSVMCDQFSSD